MKSYFLFTILQNRTHHLDFGRTKTADRRWTPRPTGRPPPPFSSLASGTKASTSSLLQCSLGRKAIQQRLCWRPSRRQEGGVSWDWVRKKDFQPFRLALMQRILSSTAASDWIGPDVNLSVVTSWSLLYNQNIDEWQATTCKSIHQSNCAIDLMDGNGVCSCSSGGGGGNQVEPFAPFNNNFW